MKRRQFTAVLATGTVSLGGLTGAVSNGIAQETEPLRIEDVSVTTGNVTNSIGLAELTFQDGTMRFEVRDWTMETANRSLAIDAVQKTVSDVSAKTFSTVRAAVVDAIESRSVSPLFSSIAEAEVNPDASVRLFVGPVEVDGQRVADEITATGTVDSVVADGTRSLLRGGPTIGEIEALGASEWSQLTIQRGDSRLVLDDVAMQLDGVMLSTTAPSGRIELPNRSLELNGVSMDLLPPETIPAPHVEFASRLRQLAAEESVTLSATRSAATESGVTVANTGEAVQNVRFDLSLEEVTEDDETLITNFETTGTLAELMTVLRQQA